MATEHRPVMLEETLAALDPKDGETVVDATFGGGGHARRILERLGPDGKVVALELKAGDRVLFGKWSGTEVRIDGEDVIIMKESDVMGVIEQSLAKKKAA